MTTPRITSRTLDTPIGLLTLAATDDGLFAVAFPQNRHPLPQRDHWRSGNHRWLDAAATQLDGYFAGRRHAFDLPLASHGTSFQQRVWHALRTIPFGTTWSYADLARAIGQPNAVRAVGAANGRNPIPIIVPCHRVIGSSGALTGFAGGLDTKLALLRLEGVFRNETACSSNPSP